MTATLVGSLVDSKFVKGTINDLEKMINDLIVGDLSIPENVPIFVGKFISSVNVRIEESAMSDFTQICKNWRSLSPEERKSVEFLRDYIVKSIKELYGMPLDGDNLTGNFSLISNTSNNHIPEVLPPLSD